jgi:hypothetical protein
MTERLLQFIWQFQYFNKHDLVLEGKKAESFRILDPGRFNTHQGPDFLEAKISIGAAIWVGHVEIHVKTSDWHRHRHQSDPHYDNVILHVVWRHDLVRQKDRIPVFCLGDRVPGLLLKQYAEWMKSLSFIACEQQIASVSELVMRSWTERLMIERLLRKSATVYSWLQQSAMHWEEVFWWMLAKNFGITVNAEAFEAVARTIPVKILARHRNQIQQLESLLFGQAGLLGPRYKEAYPKMLYKEYRFYQKKYGLRPAHVSINLLRMRPVNFPTIRLAQLAMLICQSGNIFSVVREAATVQDLRKLLNVTANDYWHYHYLFDEETVFQPKKLGVQMADNIIINTMVPMIFAYGLYHDEDLYKEKALGWMGELSAEKNSIISCFNKYGIHSKTACESQALLELKSQYCDAKRCLDCAVGNALLKRMQ